MALRCFSALLTTASACLCLYAGSASAQIIQVGDGGAVSTFEGPTVTTASGTTGLLDTADPPLSTKTRELSTVRNPYATPRAAIRMVPVGELNALFERTAIETGVDARLLHAVAWQESRFRHTSVSPKGALGIMQLMPGTARDLGVDPRNIVQNLSGGARLLARLLRQYGGNIDLALAAYNAGPGAVRRWGGVPPFAETQTYVRSIRSTLPF